MSNETDLDWLARNVHVWKSGYDLAVVQRGGGEIYVTWPSVCSSGITKKQWLTRRAELQNKPSWADATEWATNLVQIGSGAWVWCDNDRLEMKFGGGDRFEHSGNYGAILGDWRDTLEKRPEQAEFEPFVSVEDAKITIMQSDGDVKHFGGIIGRSLLLEEDAATAKQPAPKGSGNPILGMVLADLTNRALEGKEKYGEPLLAHNGRNPLWDAYQEALDLAMYLRQAIEELG